jgi:hypothetical protein
VIALARDAGPTGLPWKDLKKSDSDGLVVPAGARGLVRLHWDGRKQDPGPLRVDVTIWSGPKGKLTERTATTLTTVVSYTRAAQCAPDKLEVGVVAPRGSTRPVEFVCWSATRKDLTVAVKDPDTCFEFDAAELKPDECQALTDKLRAEGTWTRVKSAWRVRVVVHEQASDGRQLDLGSFRRTVPLTAMSDKEPLAVTAPVLHGAVQGDVQVGAVDDQNRIRLGTFRSIGGTQKTVRIRTGPGVELKYKNYTPAVLNLKVKLTPLPRESTADSAAWNLEVVVPADIPPGALPEDSAVLLLLSQPGRADRQLRVPIQGVALGG